MADLSLDALFSVKGQVAVITGGGTGIGLMMAKALENNGATVYIVGRRLEVLQKAASENNNFGKLIPVQGDVTSREDLLRIVKKVKDEQGYLNLLVANSGVVKSKGIKPGECSTVKDLQEALWDGAGTPEDFNHTLDVNVTGVYYTVVAFLELLDAGNKRRASPELPTSQVAITGSIGARRRDADVGNYSYGVSKSAVHHLGKIFTSLLRRFHIRVNVIAPGIYPSELTTNIVSPYAGETVPDTIVPLGRFGTTQDMAGLIIFLASMSGGYINGAELCTDGGRLSLFAST